MESIFGPPRARGRVSTIHSIEEAPHNLYTPFSQTSFPSRIEVIVFLLLNLQERDVIDLTQDDEDTQDAESTKEGPFEYDFKTKKWVQSSKLRKPQQQSTDDSSITIVEIEYNTEPVSFTPYTVEIPE